MCCRKHNMILKTSYTFKVKKNYTYFLQCMKTECRIYMCLKIFSNSIPGPWFKNRIFLNQREESRQQIIRCRNQVVVAIVYDNMCIFRNFKIYAIGASLIFLKISILTVYIFILALKLR